MGGLQTGRLLSGALIATGFLLFCFSSVARGQNGSEDVPNGTNLSEDFFFDDPTDPSYFYEVHKLGDSIGLRRENDSYYSRRQDWIYQAPSGWSLRAIHKKEGTFADIVILLQIRWGLRDRGPQVSFRCKDTLHT